LASSTHQQPLAVLTVSSLEEDHLSLGRILGSSHGDLRPARSCQEAVEVLRGGEIPVVICERDLPDGDWKVLLYATRLLERAPLLIVCSRTADEFLWAEVLNLGGWDVLAKPFEAQEVLWSVSFAWREWLRRESAPKASRVAAAR
jgi:DNA-binding response OmpR family regulator